MDKIRISIIIPVYNAEDYLVRCLDSILSQDFNSYEVILVDDGSTDSSALICDRYSAADSRFRTIHKPNGGVSSARNAGLDMARGEYVMFVDSDDALLPFALEHMTDSLCGEDMVLGGYAVFVGGIPDREIKPIRNISFAGDRMPEFYDESIRRNCEMLDAPWAKMFRRKSLAGLQFREDLSYAEDKLFVFTFFSRCSSIRTCAEAVYAYSIRPGSLGSDVRSDRHLLQLRSFLPSYAEALSALSKRFPSSSKVMSLYHNDLVGRYACRIMNIFMTRRTSLLDTAFIRWLYELMDADSRLGLFSLRSGQIFNILLYKIGHPGFTKGIYRFTSWVYSAFHRS